MNVLAGVGVTHILAVKNGVFALHFDAEIPEQRRVGVGGRTHEAVAGGGHEEGLAALGQVGFGGGDDGAGVGGIHHHHGVAARRFGGKTIQTTPLPEAGGGPPPSGGWPGAAGAPAGDHSSTSKFCCSRTVFMSE